MSSSIEAQLQILALIDRLPSLYGPYIIGMLAGAVCAGVLYCQCHHYTLQTGNRTFHNIIVAALVLVSLASLANYAVICFQTFVQMPYKMVHDPASIINSKGPGNFVIVVSAPGAAAFLSQLFFLDRVYRLSGNRALSFVLLLFTAAHFTTWVAATILAAMPTFRPSNTGLLSGTLLHVCAASLWTSSIVDIALTSSLVWQLARSKDGFNRATDTVLQYCLRISLVTGAITSIAATITAIALVASAQTFKGQNAYVAFTLVLPHLIACSVVGTLNYKENLREVKKRAGTTIPSLPSSDGKGGLSLIMSNQGSPIQSHDSGSPNASPVSTTARYAPWTVGRQAAPWAPLDHPPTLPYTETGTIIIRPPVQAPPVPQKYGDPHRRVAPPVPQKYPDGHYRVASA